MTAFSCLQFAAALTRASVTPFSQACTPRATAQHRAQQRCQPRHQSWRRHALAGGGGEDDQEKPNFDIDALASKLAAEAERLRQTGSLEGSDIVHAEEPAEPSQRRPQPRSSVLQPFGYEVRPHGACQHMHARAYLRLCVFAGLGPNVAGTCKPLSRVLLALTPTCHAADPAC
jgi:hypothetical protein